jgi:hypothetical protein
LSSVAGIWSRRKAAVQAEAEHELAASDAALVAEEQQKFDTMSDVEVLEALDLPDPDTLKMGDDFKGFMGKAVPDRIRRRALRTLWRSNPVLANVDQLVDYGEDFTDSATVIDNLQTAYQVGKGMLKHVEAMAKQAEAEEAPEPEVAPEVEPEAVIDEPLIALDEADDSVVVAASPTAEIEDDASESLIAARPRRMVFQAEEVS